MRAGRVDEATPIWAQVRAETPGDVWLYNNAGLEYADVGEHATALSWLTDGLRLALDTGDAERLVGQLAGLRLESLSALGLPADELQAEAEAFDRGAKAVERHLDRLSRVRKLDQFQAFLDQQRGDGDEDEPEPSLAAQRAQVMPGRMPDTVAWSWFPAEEYEAALKQWPGLAEPGGLAENHAQYCRALQAKLVEAADAGVTGTRIAPILVGALLTWSSERQMEPENARADYVADLVHVRKPNLVSDNGSLIVEYDPIAESAHRLGRALHSTGDEALTTAVIAEVETELAAVERAELGDLSGRAGSLAPRGGRVRPAPPAGCPVGLDAGAQPGPHREEHRRRPRLQREFDAVKLPS